MAPSDYKPRRLPDELEHQRELVRGAPGQAPRTSDNVLCRGANEGDATSGMVPVTAGSNTCNDYIGRELKRPIVNEGQRVNQYGSFESQPDAQDASAGNLSLQDNGDGTKRPSTLSAYIVGKDWKNFGGKADSADTSGDESHKRKKLDERQMSRPKPTRLERAAKHVPGLGIIMSLIASLFLGTAGMLVKLTTSVHGIEVAVMRAAIQLIIYATIIGARGIRWLPERAELIPVGLRAGLGGLSITLSYSALKLIPLGDATTIRFSLPIWTMIMSYFFLRESCSSFKVFAVAISISGVVLVTKPDMCVMLIHRLLNWVHLESGGELRAHERAYEQARVDELASLSGDDFVHSLNQSFANQTDGASLIRQQVVMSNMTVPSVQPTDGSANEGIRQLEGCLMALGSSICLSMSIIALRLCRRTPSEVSIFWLSALSIIIGTLTLVAMDEWSVPDNWRDVFYILLNGVCGALGQWFMTNALKVEQSGVISLARTFDIEVAFLYSAFVLGEQIRMTSVFGSILVSLGVVSVVVPKWLGCGQAASEEHEGESDTIAPASPNSNSNSNSDAASSHSSNEDGQNHLTTMTCTTSAGEILGRPGEGGNQLVCVPGAGQRR